MKTACIQEILTRKKLFESKTLLSVSHKTPSFINSKKLSKTGADLTSSVQINPNASSKDA
jgi:hypothetical protein